MLREDHYDRLSRNGRGYLRDQTIAMANLYTCVSEPQLLTIYTDGQFAAQQESQNRHLAETLARTGCLVIPFPQMGGTLEELGARNWQRMRTDIEPKYFSPLGAFNPPYMPLGYFFPPFISWMKGQIMDAVFAKTNTSKNPENIQLAEEVLQWSGYNGLFGDIYNPRLDLIVVEGEFKALSIYDAWLDLHESILMDVFRDNPHHYPYRDLTPPPFVACLGIVGVWGMLRKNKGKQGYELRPEWADVLGSVPRSVKVCFDSDSEWNIQIGHAASQMAQTLMLYKMRTEYISIPSPIHKKLGADDFLVESAQTKGYYEAAQEFYHLVQNAEPLAGGVPFNELVQATQATVDPETKAEVQGQSAIGYLKQKYRQSLLK